MDRIQQKENTFKNEVKVFWEEVQSKLNISYSELNELYKENRKYNFSAAKEIKPQDHNSNSFYNNKNNNAFMNSMEFKDHQMGSIKSKVILKYKKT